MDVVAGPKTTLGRSGHIAGYSVLVTENDTLVIIEDRRGGRVWKHAVPNHGTSISELSRRPGFRLGWGRTADFEVIGFYDLDDDNFGYAYNLTWDEGEWGYQYFGAGS